MGGEVGFVIQRNSGKRRARSASDAPNCSHRRFDFLKVAVARVWRVRGAPRSTFSMFFVVTFNDDGKRFVEVNGVNAAALYVSR